MSEDNAELCDWSKWFIGVILTNQIPALMNSHLPLVDESLAGRPPSRHVRRPQASFSSVSGKGEFNFHIWILGPSEVCAVS